MQPQQVPPAELPGAKKHLPISLILGILLIAAIGFGVWAFNGRQSIKSSADKQVANANTTLAQAQADEAKATKESETPYKSFTGPQTYGSVRFSYPKNWSAYIDETDSTEPVNGYFYPGIVPGIQSDTAFALRVELVDNDYGTILDQYQSSIQDGSLKASAYIPPKMKGVSGAQVGTRLNGEVGQDADGNSLNGSLVILKVRDKTLQIYTESNDYLSQLNKVVLASLTYKP